MPFVATSDDTGIFYEESGKGDPILLIGGWCMSTPYWRKQVNDLSKTNRVIAMDPRGYGQSVKVTYGHRMSRHAADVHDLLTALDLKHVVAIGWSLASNALLAYVELFGVKRLRGIGLIDQTPCVMNKRGWDLGFGDIATLGDLHGKILSNFTETVTGVIQNSFASPPSPAELEWMVAECKRTPGEVAAAIFWDHVNQDWRDMLPTVKVPALVMTGRNSKLFPWQSGEYLAAHLPKAEWVVFENSGHAPFFEEPEKFNATVRRFAA